MKARRASKPADAVVATSWPGEQGKWRITVPEKTRQLRIKTTLTRQAPGWLALHPAPSSWQPGGIREVRIALLQERIATLLAFGGSVEEMGGLPGQLLYAS